MYIPITLCSQETLLVQLLLSSHFNQINEISDMKNVLNYKNSGILLNNHTTDSTTYDDIIG